MTTMPTFLTSVASRRSGCDTSAPAAERSWITWVICVAYGAASLARVWAFTTRVAAMSSMARVIFLVFCTLAMRLRNTRSCAPGMRVLCSASRT